MSSFQNRVVIETTMILCGWFTVRNYSNDLTINIACRLVNGAQQPAKILETINCIMQPANIKFCVAFECACNLVISIQIFTVSCGSTSKRKECLENYLMHRPS